jgi:hypothetical protein
MPTFVNSQIIIILCNHIFFIIAEININNFGHQKSEKQNMLIMNIVRFNQRIIICFFSWLGKKLIVRKNIFAKFRAKLVYLLFHYNNTLKEQQSNGQWLILSRLGNEDNIFGHFSLLL